MRARWHTGAVGERDLVILSEEPLNGETRLDASTETITPAGRHYVRTHFGIPPAPDSIVIDGTNMPPTEISSEELRALPSRSLTVTLECAGNGRQFLDPRVPGEQWGLGAVGTATWTGPSFRELLGGRPIPQSTVEVLFRGADEGIPKDLGKRVAYERSLPLDVALRDEVIVAYLMNGVEIPREHGGPLRLVVPGWYGMASAKWLTHITLLDQPFTGFFQKDRYVVDGAPLREIMPRSVITAPSDGSEIAGPAVEVRGYAWSGTGPIERVEVLWGMPPGDARDAELGPIATPFAWRAFHKRLSIAPPDGARSVTLDLAARAHDAAGNAQPLAPRWNELGYQNNAVRPVRIRVTG
jgi:DMSO/TMAO reductase YedYZ molybdopterin-dependent catalytic subunit